MDRKRVTLIVFAIGIVLVLVGSLSDVIGFGADGFGPGQTILIIAGAGLVGFGLWELIAPKSGG